MLEEHVQAQRMRGSPEIDKDDEEEDEDTVEHGRG
jgi:hypothetical protein